MIVFLPKWFPFHHSTRWLHWSRTVIVPLLVLMALKPKARNPKSVRVDELFIVPPEDVKNWHSNTTQSICLNPVCVPRASMLLLRCFEPYMPARSCAKMPLSKTCVACQVTERLNGEDGLGAIYPAMANSVMMYDSPLAYAHQIIPMPRSRAKRSINSLIDGPDRSYCQPCLSPIWDTALALHALMESGADRTKLEKACDWLVSKQILDTVGDWADWRPNVRPGGWAFQYNNAHYPDVDDTAVVVMALDRCDKQKYREAIERGAEWVLGMQSKNGGWGAFDADNDYYYLNHIPFADHGALLDPPSADVSARCLSMLAQLGYRKDHPKIAAAIDYLRREQEYEGCWFGRWGTNYIYGTWSVLCALNAIGISSKDPMIRRAVEWLISKQRDDGGWGEDGASYWAGQPKGECPVSTPAQTSWALLGLMAAGELDHPCRYEKGIRHLTDTQTIKTGLWREDYYTAVGFPRVFYLSYHGYKAFFPRLGACALQESAARRNAPQVLLWDMKHARYSLRH